MRIEVKGLIAGLTAALVVLGLTFGLAALVAHGRTMQVQHKAAKLTQVAQTTGKSSPAANAAFVVQGHVLLTQTCVSCHGPDATGGFGPSLHHEDMSDAEITGTIQNGVKGKMPAFGKKYDAQQTQALVAYIHSLK